MFYKKCALVVLLFNVIFFKFNEKLLALMLY
jgi:hypothetical protein